MNDIADKHTWSDVDEAFALPVDLDPEPRAPVLPDAREVEESFQTAEATEQTIKDITSHAEAANHLAKMAADLRHTITGALYERKPDGELTLRGGVDMSQAKQASSLIIALGNAIKSNNATYRLNKGLADSKTETDVRGHVTYDGKDAHKILTRELGLGNIKTPGDSEALPS